MDAHRTTTVGDERTDADRAADRAWIEEALVKYRDRLEWLREH